MLSEVCRMAVAQAVSKDAPPIPKIVEDDRMLSALVVLVKAHFQVGLSQSVINAGGELFDPDPEKGLEEHQAELTAVEWKLANR